MKLRYILICLISFITLLGIGSILIDAYKSIKGMCSINL